MAHIKLGTRKSPLALWQAEHVAAALSASEPGLTVELVKMSTSGDRILDAPLSRVGGKGLFVKEIEEALLQGEIDLAVHSLKDVPVDLPPGLTLAAFPRRADPHDGWISPFGAVAELPRGARVGTSSLRRQCQLLAQRPDLEIVPVRGSVQTRLQKLDTENLSAVVLAAAGLDRLGLADRMKRRLTAEEMLPAVGQGILAIEIREDDHATRKRVATLHDADAHAAALTERAMLRALGGGCQVPVAGHAVREGGTWWLRGLVASPDGKTVVRADARAPARAEPELGTLGLGVAQQLVKRGGGDILRAMGVEPTA